LVHAYNLIQIWIVNILSVSYDLGFFYFIPFLIILFVQDYGVRDISLEIKKIESEKWNANRDLVKQHIANFGHRSTFLKYY